MDLQKVVDKGMNPRDKSSPRNPSDYKKSDANDPDMYNPKKGARLGQIGEDKFSMQDIVMFDPILFRQQYPLFTKYDYLSRRDVANEF